MTNFNRLHIKAILLSIFLVFNIFNTSGQTAHRKMVVVIDPGHGGKDPGAMGPVGNEKDLVLTVGRKLGKYIEQNFPDVKVIYTRKTDVFIELYRRAQIANKAKADLFISIHANSNKNPKAHGAETFVMGLHRSKSNLEVAKKENAVILQEDNYQEQYEGFDPNSDEAQIIFSLYQNQFLNQSLFLAAEIEKQFKNRVGRYDRGVKQAGFWVLYKTVMPSVLIELGFVSNKEEAKFLFSEKGSDYMASAIYRAFKKYKKEVFDANHHLDIDDEETNNKTTAKQKSQTKHDIYFSVQIATSKNKVKIKPSKFKGLKDVFEYKEGGYYKYFYGKVKTYSELIKLEKQIRKKFKDAYGVGFVDGKKTSVKKANSYLKK